MEGCTNSLIFPSTWILRSCEIRESKFLLDITRAEEMRKQGLFQWLDSLQIDNTASPDLQLTMGAVIVEEVRAAIERQTGFQCSAGISHNKVKTSSGLQREAWIIFS